MTLDELFEAVKLQTDKLSTEDFENIRGLYDLLYPNGGEFDQRDVDELRRSLEQFLSVNEGATHG